MHHLQAVAAAISKLEEASAEPASPGESPAKSGSPQPAAGETLSAAVKGGDKRESDVFDVLKSPPPLSAAAATPAAAPEDQQDQSPAPSLAGGQTADPPAEGKQSADEPAGQVSQPRPGLVGKQYKVVATAALRAAAAPDSKKIGKLQVEDDPADPTRGPCLRSNVTSLKRPPYRVLIYLVSGRSVTRSRWWMRSRSARRSGCNVCSRLRLVSAWHLPARSPCLPAIIPLLCFHRLSQ